MSTPRPQSIGSDPRSGPSFTVHVDLLDGRIRLAGLLDRGTVHLFQEAISALLLGDHDTCVVDTTGLIGCDQIGVRAIGAAYRRALRHKPADDADRSTRPYSSSRWRGCAWTTTSSMAPSVPGGPRLAARLTSAPPRQPAPAPGRRRGARPPSRPRSSRETCPIRTGQTLAAAALGLPEVRRRPQQWARICRSLQA